MMAETGGDTLMGPGVGFQETRAESDDILCGSGIDRLYYGPTDAWSILDSETRIATD